MILRMRLFRALAFTVAGSVIATLVFTSTPWWKIVGTTTTTMLFAGPCVVLCVFGLPLVNFYLPELANRPVLGFTATWLFLGVLFFPITWLLSAYFVHHSNRIETEFASSSRAEGVSEEAISATEERR